MIASDSHVLAGNTPMIARNKAARIAVAILLSLSSFPQSARAQTVASPYFRFNAYSLEAPSTTPPGPTTPTPGNDEMLVRINGPLTARVATPFAMSAQAVNPPATETVAWSMAPDSSPLPNGLAIDPSSGGIAGVRQSPGLTPVLKIRAQTASRAASSAPFRILFRDAGAVGTASITPAPARVGESYSIQATASGMDSPVAWAVASGALPPGLSLTGSGSIQGVPTTVGTWAGIALVATGPSDAAVTPTFSIVVSSPASTALSLTSRTLSGTVGNYMSSGISAYGGAAPYTYELVSGSLPPGLAFNTAGARFEGVPTTVGTWPNIQVRAIDASSATATATVTVVVSPKPAFSIRANSPIDGYVGTPLVVPVQRYNASGAVTYDLAAGTLPPGMALSATTGSIEGTPTAVGEQHGIVVRGTDSASNVATTDYITIRVNPAVPFTVDVASRTVPFNVRATVQPTVSVAGTYSYAWDTSVQATPPSGVSLNASTGLISVQRSVPGATGNMRIVATATSGPQAGTSARSNLFWFNVQSTGTFEVVMPDEIGPATVADYYSVEFAVRGQGGTGPVTGPITWSTESTLPPGIKLDPTTGRLQGTATVSSASASWVAVTATDAEGRVARSPNFQMRAADRMVIAWASGYPNPKGYKVRQSFTLRARILQGQPEKAKVETWAYRSWESDPAKQHVVNSKVYLQGDAGTLPLAYTNVSGQIIDYNVAATRFAGQGGFQIGKFDHRIAMAGDPSDVGTYTTRLVYEDARMKPAMTDPATFAIIGPLTLRDYLSRPATDINWESNYQYGKCNYTATYVPAGQGGVEGLDEIRVIAVPGSWLDLKPLFNNDPDGTAMPYFEQIPWPGNGIPELPPTAGTMTHKALGTYGGGGAIEKSQAPGYYKNVVAIYDGVIDVYTYYNVKTLLNPPGSACNTSSPGNWN